MEKLTFRALKSHDDTDLFLNKVENYTGVRLPLDYVARSKVVGVFLHNKLVAGYMLVTQPNFRSVMFVPDQIKKTNNFFEKDKYEMMEVNGLWIGPGLKTPSLQLRVWMNLIKDIFSCRKKYVLLMRNSRNRNMERFLGMANPTKLYSGEPLVMSGNMTHDLIEVGFTTRWSIVLNIHKYLIELIQRHRRASKYAKQRDASKALKHSEARLA